MTHPPELKENTPCIPQEQQLLIWLKELEPLQKVHYSWPLTFEKLSDPLLYEYVRLTHAVSLSGEDCNLEEIERSVKICKQVNETQPKPPASIGINYSVWHHYFDNDDSNRELPDEKKRPPTEKGDPHDAELNHLKMRLEMIRDWLKTSNQNHNTNIAITAVLFDSERFRTCQEQNEYNKYRVEAGKQPLGPNCKDETEWNRALTQKYNAAYDVAHSIFPKARIEWYARGAAHRSASTSNGWDTSSYFALDEKGESFACSLYQVPEIGYTREIFRRTFQNATKYSCVKVTPWVALAAGYRRQVGMGSIFSFDWNYDLIYSWQLGAEINHWWFGAPERQERFAPWNAAKIAVFFPQPFTRSPVWGLHFVAYVRGAHQIKELPVVEATCE